MPKLYSRESAAACVRVSLLPLWDHQVPVKVPYLIYFPDTSKLVIHTMETLYIYHCKIVSSEQLLKMKRTNAYENSVFIALSINFNKSCWKKFQKYFYIKKKTLF